MMKKQTLVLLACALSSVLAASDALASKARLLSLGQDENGSPYLEDSRMIFLNPALLHRQKDFANFEMGSSTVPSTPNAEGGLFRSFGAANLGDFKLGAQLGRESNAASKIATINSYMGLGLISPQNTFELMAAGGSQLKWGASLLYGSAEDKAEIVAPATSAFPNREASTLEVRGGLTTDLWHAYAHLDLQSRSESEIASGQNHKYEGDPSLRLGGSVDLAEDQKAYAELFLWNYEGRNAANTGDRDASLTSLTAGFVQFLNPEAGTRLFYTAGLGISNFKLKAAPGGNEDKLEQLFVPVALGLESDATDWLVLRASVTQRVLIDRRKTTVTDVHNPNSTSVAAGTGIKWRKLVLDATLAGSGSGTIDGNSLLANASLTYLF